MVKIGSVAAAMAVFGVALATSENVQAQEKPPTGPPGPEATSPDATLEGASITMRVDGMSCPFCAYGLEKRILEIEAVDAVLIRVGDGLVQIRAKQNMSVEDEALRGAVDRAGFTLREIHRMEG